MTAGGRTRVFLSWSGDPSKAFAEAVADALETLSDRLDPWLSDDLPAGVEWANALVPNIKRAQFAILCLTHRNVNAPWIAFETGAYFTSRLRKGVVPYLLDFKREELQFPLGLFQSQETDWKGTKAVFVRVGELVGMDAKAVEDKLTGEIWDQLDDRLKTIRGLRDRTRTDEPGNWMNVANAFYLGHDLRWTIDVIENGSPPSDVKHGLLQTLHQADELGLSEHDYFVILAKQAADVFDIPDEEWTSEIRERLDGAVKEAFDRFGRLVIERQPGYHACDPKNREAWLRYQAARRA